VQVGRRILDAAQREGLDGSVTDFTHAVDHLRLEEALGLEIVHQVVGVIGGGVASTALALAEEDLLAAQLGSDVPFALHGGTALGTGRGEELATVLARNTFHWVLAFAERGLSTRTVFGELDRLREVGTPPRLDEPGPVLAALAAGDPEQLAPLLGNEMQASALSLNSALRRVLRAGVEAGALAGIVSGSGPTCAFLCRSAPSAVDVGTELSGAGVCRTVRVASGPVHGARVVPTPVRDV